MGIRRHWFKFCVASFRKNFSYPGLKLFTLCWLKGWAAVTKKHQKVFYQKVGSRKWEFISLAKSSLTDVVGGVILSKRSSRDPAVLTFPWALPYLHGGRRLQAPRSHTGRCTRPFCLHLVHSWPHLAAREMGTSAFRLGCSGPVKKERKD